MRLSIHPTVSSDGAEAAAVGRCSRCGASEALHERPGSGTCGHTAVARSSPTPHQNQTCSALAGLTTGNGGNPIRISRP